METKDNESKKALAEETLRKEWDLLKKTGLLCQIGCSAGPRIIKREGKKPIYDMFNWNAFISGPKKSPYEGYLFKFEIEYPQDYPKKAPTVTCKSNIYHMNISSSGDVCVSSIKKEGGWAQAGDISTVLLSIFCILAKEPDQNALDSPYRSDLRDLYLKDKKNNIEYYKTEYYKNAREECKKYGIKIS